MRYPSDATYDAIGRCDGDEDSNCGHWEPCLAYYDLAVHNVTSIGDSENITFYILKTHQVNKFCDDSINANITVSCMSSVTCPPTPDCGSTASPTKEETPSPTKGEDIQFIVGTENMNFSAAEAWCVEQGSHLASIHSDWENEVAYTKCGGECWIGLECIDKDQYDYEWMDGSDWDYTNWNEGEPNNWQNTDEDCVHLYSNGEWNDNQCTSRGYKPLCNELKGTLSVF